MKKKISDLWSTWTYQHKLCKYTNIHITMAERKEKIWINESETKIGNESNEWRIMVQRQDHRGMLVVPSMDRGSVQRRAPAAAFRKTSTYPSYLDGTRRENAFSRVQSTVTRVSWKRSTSHHRRYAIFPPTFPPCFPFSFPVQFTRNSLNETGEKILYFPRIRRKSL